MKKDDMQNQTRLILRGSTYHLRVKIPTDLRGALKQRWEITKSLRTKDRREAERLARKESVRLDEEFQRLRTQRDTPPRSEITDDEIKRLVAVAVQSTLQADEEGRMLGLSDDEFARTEQWLKEGEEVATAGIARGSFAEELQEKAEEWLREHGFALPRASEGFRRFAYEFTRGYAAAIRIKRARQSGEPVPTPQAEPFKATERATSSKGNKIRALLAYWMEQAPRKPKTAHEFKTAVRRFEELHGKMAATEITRDHVIAFKDKLISSGAARGTVKKQLGALAAVLQLAADNNKIPTNPARGVRLPKVKVEKKKRVSFEPADLKRIFHSPVFQKGERPQAGAGEAAYWLPVLALYHGARLNEIGQLRCTDVKEEQGITYLDISDASEGDTLKTESSRRRVPLHPEVARMGFLDYVERMRKAGGGRVFPELRQDRLGHLTGNWSKWFGRYLRNEVGITDARKTFHSFRHTFKDACRAAHIGQEVHDALTGHAPGANEGRGYGADHFPLRPLAKAIAKVRYPGLVIPKPSA